MSEAEASSNSTQRMATRRGLQGYAFGFLVLFSATLVFVLTYFLTAFFYQWLGRQPNPFWTQLINSVLGLIFFFSLIFLFGYFVRDRRWHIERNIFGPIFEAMSKIAKGDFSVQLESSGEDNPLVNELTKHVNSMALELKQLESMRQEFVSNVSHEIQSPLTSIRGFAHTLQNDNLSDDERSHYLTIIETESVRLSNLADNLLKLASLEAEQATFAPKSYRLDKQIRSLLLICEPQWNAKSIQMDISLEEVTIYGDEELLSQVWLNLIHNSIKFTPEGGNICVNLCQEDRHEDKGLAAQFSISDTGIGIAEEDQPHIFERFYKADKSRQRSKGGNGLGLSIAQKIVAMHHGTITVSSKLGAGATFTVCLPLEQMQ